MDVPDALEQLSNASHSLKLFVSWLESQTDEQIREFSNDDWMALFSAGQRGELGLVIERGRAKPVLEEHVRDPDRSGSHHQYQQGREDADDHREEQFDRRLHRALLGALASLGP